MSIESSDGLTPAQKAASTKRQAYDTKVKIALKELTTDPKRKSISVADICERAGVQTDSFYKAHHRDLRILVRDELKSWNSAKLSKRGKRPPASEAEAQIRQLEADNKELDRKLRNAQRALNILGQMLESALSARGLPAVLPLRRPQKST